jgi:hypothetical protein
MAALTKKSIAAIKKAGHSDRKKPVPEVTDGLPRRHALALPGSLGTITADTKKVQKRTLSAEEVEQLLSTVIRWTLQSVRIC